MKINRRTFVAGTGAALAAAGIGGISWRSPRASGPNIVLFIADDLRYDATGFTGNRIVRTPHLDALAKTGLVFDRYYVTTSMCPTSRASMMSGEYVMRHKVGNFSTEMSAPSLKRIFPRLLQRQGYETGFIGKWGIHGRQPVPGFDQWMGFQGIGDYYSEGETTHLTDIQTAQALKFLKQTPQGRPFLLVVAYKAPHVPLYPQRRFEHLYKNTVFPRASSDTDKDLAHLPKILATAHEHRTYVKRLEDPNDYQMAMRQYYQLITGLDDSIGQILAQIGTMGIMDDTSVIFTSDNGMMMGEHGLKNKWLMFEPSIRVPLLVHPAKRYFPAIKPTRLNQLALNIDIAPTVLSMAATGIPGEVQGKNLLEIAHDPALSWRQGFYYVAPHDLRTLVCEGYYESSGWKYAHYQERKKSGECLFNLNTDPGEIKNLADNPAHKDKLAEMRTLMEEEKRRVS